MAIVTVESEYKTAISLSNGTSLNDLEWPLIQISMSRYIRQITRKMVQRRAVLTMADQ